jgi:hypothetical protein
MSLFFWAARPLAARAQQPGMRWISVVIPPAENDPEGRG